MLVSLGAVRIATLAAVFLSSLLSLPRTTLAQTETAAPVPACSYCQVYAAEELNLRQEPSQDAVVLRIVPAGAPLLRGTGPEEAGYAPVTYDGVPGWVVALALSASPAGIGAATNANAEPTATAPDPALAAPAPAPSDQRQTLEPLVLRSGPSTDAEPVLTMPQGALVTLTREGAENGYVTVAYEDVTGWAYADFLGEVAGAG